MLKKPSRQVRWNKNGRWASGGGESESAEVASKLRRRRDGLGQKSRNNVLMYIYSQGHLGITLAVGEEDKSLRRKMQQTEQGGMSAAG